MAKEIITSIASDILSKFGIPTATFQTLFNNLLNKKIENAKDIIIDEIKDGNFSRIDEDETISILYRFMQSAMSGTSKINLRLLAKLINSLSNGEKLKAGLYSNQFNLYAQALETLNYEEIQFLAVLHKHKSSNYMHDIDFYYCAKDELNDSNILNSEELKSTGDALLRTGLIYNAQSQLQFAYYELSPFFYKIITLVDFQDALDKENNSL